MIQILKRLLLKSSLVFTYSRTKQPDFIQNIKFPTLRYHDKLSWLWVENLIFNNRVKNFLVINVLSGHGWWPEIPAFRFFVNWLTRNKKKKGFKLIISI